MTLVMVSVIQKFSKHYSLAKWILCSTGLIRFLHPTDKELKELAGKVYKILDFFCCNIYEIFINCFFLSGVPKSIQKSKKDRNKHHHSNNESTTFHVPRNLDIQLEVSKVTPYDVTSLRYYQEYQWLVDFSLYASIIYCISEVYHFFIPLKEEVNLSMVWCLLVIFFAL